MMPLVLFAIISAPLVSGLVLPEDLEEGPQVDLEEAMRVRQYVLLNAPSAISMLSTSTGESGSHSELLGGSAESIGQAASLNEAGFSSVAATKSTAAMGVFVRRLLDSAGLRVTNEAFMNSVLPYYNGECAKQPYAALIQELHMAKRARSCHPAWVAKKEAYDLDAGKNFMKPFIEVDKEKAAVKLVHAVMNELGVTTKKGENTHLMRFVTRFLAKNGTLVDLQRKLLETDKLEKWADFGDAVDKPTFAGTGGVFGWFAEIGNVAPLNEQGYQAVVYMRDDSQMESFIRRAAKHEGLHIANKGGLTGMAPYYSGLCARQSYDSLTRELRSLVGQSFVMKFALDFAAGHMPHRSELKKIIAQRAGVDVRQIKLEKIESDTVERSFNRRQRRHQRKQESKGDESASEAIEPQTLIAKEPTSPVDEAHETAERKAFEVSISVDSASRVHQIKKTIKDASSFPGDFRVTMPKAVELEPSKPTHCGGGMVVPN